MKQLQIYYGGVKVLNKKTGQTEVIENCIYKENATPKEKHIIKPTLYKNGVSRRNYDKYEITQFMFDTAKKVGKTVYYV
ncbi:MAG: hypothetical protein WCS66_09100 [Bacteroidales bacterium]